MRFYIETYGCTANQGDSKRIEAMLKKEGHEKVEMVENADVVIVNTCIVTKRTELNVIKRICQLKNKKLVVAGCMPAVFPELIFQNVGKVETIALESLDNLFDYESEGVIGTVNISRGCIGNCSYCIVKKARGDLLSYPPEKILRSVRALVERGVKEVRITAQDCSAYGLDIGRRFPELLEMLCDIEGNFRIRVGMMNPSTIKEILDDLIDVFENEKVFKFLHAPVQSGSNRVLKKMRRDYTVEEFVEIVDSFRRRFDEITISTDFIVGFPTETEEDFEESLNLLRRIEAEKVNITRFSRRPGTEAAKMKDILERIKKERSRKFTRLYHEIAEEKNRRLIGKKLHVLITERGKKRGVIGRDSAYRNVVIGEDLSLGSEVEVVVTGARSTYLIGNRTHQKIYNGSITIIG
ncbi:MAG: tRNA (N(6)-L-threonylcarbamoyladenosine(37)-C(2))-methylthiotransferase [Candidatus Syntropharchaeia archaeon]